MYHNIHDLSVYRPAFPKAMLFKGVNSFHLHSPRNHNRCPIKSYWMNECINKWMRLIPALKLDYIRQSLAVAFRDYLTLWYNWTCIITKIITHIITTKSSFRIQIFHDIHQPKKPKKTEKENLILHTSKKIPSAVTSCALMKTMWLEFV